MKFTRSRPSIDTLCTSPLPVHASAFLRQSANQAVCHVSPSSFLTTSMLYSLYGVVSLLHPTTNHGVHSVLCVESPDYSGRVLTRLKMQGSHPPKNSPKQQHLRLHNFTLMPFTLISPVWPFPKNVSASGTFCHRNGSTRPTQMTSKSHLSRQKTMRRIAEQHTARRNLRFTTPSMSQ